MQRRALFISTVALTAALAWRSNAAAPATGIGLSVTPAKIDLAARIGQMYTIGLTARNADAQRVHVQIAASDFALDSEGKYAYARAGSSRTSLATWLAVSPREFDLAPQSFQQIQFTLRVPNDTALSGEYAGVLFVQTRPGRERGALMLSARVAVKVYATIVDTSQVRGAVTALTATATSASERYRVVFRNTGNRHVYLNGRVDVVHDRTIVQTLSFPPSLLVERGGERAIELDGRRLAPGAYDAIAKLDYGGPTKTGGRIQFHAQ